MNIVQKVAAIHVAALLRAHFLDMLQDAVDALPDGEREEKQYHLELLASHLGDIGGLGGNGATKLQLKEAIAYTLSYMDDEIFEELQDSMVAVWHRVCESGLPEIVD